MLPMILLKNGPLNIFVNKLFSHISVSFRTSILDQTIHVWLFPYIYYRN